MWELCRIGAFCFPEKMLLVSRNRIVAISSLNNQERLQTAARHARGRPPLCGKTKRSGKTPGTR